MAEDGREENNSQDKVPTVIRSPKSVVSNGINGTGNEEAMTDADSLKKADSNHQLDAKSISKVESDDWNAQKPVKLEAKHEHAEAQQVPHNDEISSKDVHISPEVKSVEAAKSLDKVENNSVRFSPSRAPENEAVNVASPTQSGSLPDESRSKKDSLAKRKENLVREEVASVDNASKKTSEEEYISEAKKQRRSGKKRDDETIDKDKALTDEGASKNNDGGTSDSEGRYLEQTEKLGDASDKTEDGSSFRKEDGGKVGRAKPMSGKDVLKCSAREDHGKVIQCSLENVHLVSVAFPDHCFSLCILCFFLWFIM